LKRREKIVMEEDKDLKGSNKSKKGSNKSRPKISGQVAGGGSQGSSNFGMNSHS
jgi:hypothetical protein